MTIPTTECDAVVVASDGERLNVDNVIDVELWLDGLRDYERETHTYEFKPHDDVAVIAARIATHPAG